jgi:hypothetical protein
VIVSTRRCHKLAPSVRRGRGFTVSEIVNLGRVLSVIAIFHEPLEYLTELQRQSAGVAARPSECMPLEPAMLARLRDYASSLAILPDAVSFG